MPDFQATPLIPAATIMLLREEKDRLEVLMLRRNRHLKAFGGAWVFPGGRVDDEDAPGADDIMRAKAAAIRETQEETGLDISDRSMETLSCWIPPVQEKRRFSTWFFIVAAPDSPVKIDHGEIHDFRWVCPKETLGLVPSEDMMIMPPTYVSLHTLAQHKTIKSVMDETRARPSEIFETKFKKSEAGFITFWQGDVAYETQDLSLDGPRRRLVCGPGKWDYQARVR